MIVRMLTLLSLLLLIAVVIAWAASFGQELTLDCILPGPAFFLADVLDGHLMIWIIPDVELDETFQETRRTIGLEGLGSLGKLWRTPWSYYASPWEWSVGNTFLLVGSDSRYTQALGVPLWIPAGLLAVLPAIRFAYMPLRSRRRRRRKQCVACGYLLIGNVSGICPECGRPFDLKSVANHEKKTTAKRDRNPDAARF